MKVHGEVDAWVVRGWCFDDRAAGKPVLCWLQVLVGRIHFQLAGYDWQDDHISLILLLFREFFCLGRFVMLVPAAFARGVGLTSPDEESRSAKQMMWRRQRTVEQWMQRKALAGFRDVVVTSGGLFLSHPRLPRLFHPGEVLG